MSEIQSEANNTFQRATQLQREGRLEEAIALYREAIEKNPNFAWYYHDLGEALIALGDPKEAIECYRKAVEISPESGLFNYGLAEVLNRDGKLNEAINFYKNAVTRGSGYHKFYCHFGKALAKQGNLNQAVAQYRKAIELNSKNYHYHIELAQAFAKLQDWDNAIHYYRSANNLNPNALDSEFRDLLIEENPGSTFKVNSHKISKGDLDSNRYGKVVFKGKEVYISSNHFSPVSENNQAKKLFKNSVRRVNVEVFSFCNRQCVFCPNKYGTRLNENQYLDENIYLKIVNELASINYDGRFGFHQYNETLSDKIILKRITQARSKLPQANITITTNGDYLDFNYLQELNSAGLSGLYINIYGPKNGIFDDQYISSRINKMAIKLGINEVKPSYKKRFGYSLKASHKSTSINISGRDISSIGYNRGELVETGPNVANRSSPCFSPFENLEVDYRGNILPCCNIYPDFSEHSQYVTSSLKDGRSIFEHYANSKLVNWRRNLIRFFPKGSPCQSCSRSELPELVTLKSVDGVNIFAEKLMKLSNQ